MWTIGTAWKTLMNSINRVHDIRYGVGISKDFSEAVTSNLRPPGG